MTPGPKECQCCKTIIITGDVIVDKGAGFNVIKNYHSVATCEMLK